MIVSILFCFEKWAPRAPRELCGPGPIGPWAHWALGPYGPWAHMGCFMDTRT